MIRSLLRQKLFYLIFPRGKQYVHNTLYEEGFEKTTSDTRKLCIWYKIQNNHPETGGVVILSHPYVKSAKLFFVEKHVDMYLSMGYHVVTFDFNGFGQSPFQDFHFDKDLVDVASWAQTKFHSKNIICHGISFGAAQIIRAAHSGNLEASAIIIENCLDKSIHYFKVRNRKIYYFIKTLHLFSQQLKKQGDYVFILSQVTAHLKAAFIYCEEDDLTTTNMGNLLMGECKLPYSFLSCKGKHLKAIDAGEKYKGFLEEFVRGEV